MALTTLQNLILKGVLDDFHERMDSAPQLWTPYAQEVKSTTNQETYVFAGNLPIPRVFTDSRSFQEFTDYKFNIVNETYELSFIIGLEFFEDDQTGIIQERFQDLASAWGLYKNQLFADKLINGGDATLGIPPLNSDPDITMATFFGGSLSWGGSSTMDNDRTTVIADDSTANPTVAEIHLALKENKQVMMKFTDDKGRPIHNFTASQKMRLIVPVEYDIRFAEALNSTFTIGDDTAGGSKDNVAFKGFAPYDVNPFLTDSDRFYMMMLGGTKKPFIYQNRVPLNIVIDQTSEGIARNNGIAVMCRERFNLEYGDPLRASRHIFTT